MLYCTLAIVQYMQQYSELMMVRTCHKQSWYYLNY